MPITSITPSDTLAITRERCLPAIEHKLLSFLQSRGRDGIRWNAEMAQYQFSTGGKRLRALIPCWVYLSCGENPLDAVTIGCAIEMIHNATLVHDDLQDGDTLRRGKPTVWKKYSAAQAINCGDAMFQFGLQLLLQLPAEPELLRRMSQRLLRGVTQVIEGQAREFLLKEEEIPTLSNYIQVARGKTGALIAAALTLPVESLGVSAAYCEDVEKAGLDLGILFQMQDDLLDIYGEKGRESRATDIAEGKISILIAQLLEDASGEHRRRTLEILRKPRERTTESEISEVLNLFERYQTKAAVIRQIEMCRERIRDFPWQTEVPGLHQVLVEMSEQFLRPIRHLMDS